MSTTLATHGVTKRFDVGGGKQLTAVEDVTVEIAAGETLGLVGESGSGKTTFGRCVVRMYRPEAGTILFRGQPIEALDEQALGAVRRKIQLVFQNPMTSLNPRMTVGQAVIEPLEVHRQGSAAERRARLAEILGQVGLNDSQAASYPHQLSGGQRQRVGIARALALSPDLLVLDEPTASLDVSVQAQIVNLLGDLQAELGLAYLFISHDLPLVRHLSHRVAVMYLGRVVELGPSGALFERPLHPYTVALMGARHRNADGKRATLAGEVPSPIDRPSGCAFRTRCPIAKERCRSDRPELVEIEPGHSAACHFPGEYKLRAAAAANSDRAAQVPA